MNGFNRKDILIIIIGVIIVVSTFFGINYIIDYNSPNRINNNLISNIRKAAYKYGRDNIEYFKKNKEMYMTVDTLVTSGYLQSNSLDGISYIDNLSNEQFKGTIYIYYDVDKIRTYYFANYKLNTNDIMQNTDASDFNISVDNITSNSITVSINDINSKINFLEYYLDNYLVYETNEKQYIYENLTYGIHQLKVIGYDNENKKIEKTVAISTNKIEKPVISQKNNIVIIKYPSDSKNYTFEYKVNNGEWIKVYENIFNLDITKNSSIIARVSDGNNMIESPVYNLIYIKEEDKEVVLEDKPENIIYYNVSFDLNGGSGKIPLQKVTPSSSVIKPLAEPTKDGYEFMGWYKEEKIYNFSSPVYNDLTLIAKWSKKEIIKYQITLDYNDNSGKKDYVKVEEGNNLQKPVEPLRNGYEFEGWYKGGKVYNFADSIYNNFTLIAKWSKKEVIKYQITLDYNDGTNNKDVLMIESGSKITKPNNPKRAGYEFVGWYRDGKIYSFSNRVVNNFTLIAQWSKEETTKYQIILDYNDGTGDKEDFIIEAGKKIEKPSTPSRNNYEFLGWYKGNNLYNFNSKVDSNFTLKAKWKKINNVNYNIVFDYNDGSGKTSSSIVEEGKILSKPTNPTRSGYEFLGWYKDNKIYDFSGAIYDDFTLKAKWEAKNIDAATIEYSVVNSNGKWIFINNPEKLLLEYLTDNNNGKALYSDYINGNAEIYFEHNIINESSLKGNYAIRFYNPTNSSIELKINKCGTSLTRADGNTYVKTWREYYGFSKCPLVGEKYTIAPTGSKYIYLSGVQTGGGWNDWDDVLSTSLPKTKLPESTIDGVFNVTSSGKLYVETFFFTDHQTISSNLGYDNKNYVAFSLTSNRVYSGYYNKLPKVSTNINFEINDNTPNGNLKVKYDKGNTSEREIWYTHNDGNSTPKGETYLNDCLKLNVSNNKFNNWGNWAVHYTENITIKNNGTKDRTVAYYINAYHGKTENSAIIAFPLSNLNYKYKRSGIGKWHTGTDAFEKIWEIIVPARQSITVPTEVLLGGNSSGTLGRKITVNK